MKYDTTELEKQIDALREARKAVQAKLEALSPFDPQFLTLASSFAVAVDHYDDAIEAALLQKENMQHNAEAADYAELHELQSDLRGGL